jgi:hypothetical protein
VNHNERRAVTVRSGVPADGQNLDDNERRAVRVRSGVRAGHRRQYQ